MLKVEGTQELSVYSGQVSDKIYLAEGSTVQEMPYSNQPKAQVANNKTKRVELGKVIYKQNCQACHQSEGQGVNGAFPPLAKSDYLNADLERSISVVAHGLEGQIKVNGQVFNSTMPKLKLSDEEIANVLTYVYNNWGNNGKEVTPDMVAKVKAKGEH